MKRVPPKPARRRAKSRKTQRFSSDKLLKYSLIALLSVSLITTAYHYRHGVLYWLGFKTDKRIESLTKEERRIENLRIYEIVNRYKENVFGIDVSHYQGNINWDSVQNGSQAFPLHFVFVRATAGKNGKDRTFRINWQKAKDHGFLRGAYHYYRPDENSLEQAKFFVKTVKLGEGDLPPVLDIEQMPNGQSMDSLKSGLKRWLDTVESHYGVQPILYSGESFYTDFLEEEFTEYKLWIANYSFFDNKMKPNWLFWQFTDKATINGIEGDVDVNVYSGQLDGLKGLTK